MPSRCCFRDVRFALLLGAFALLSPAARAASAYPAPAQPRPAYVAPQSATPASTTVLPDLLSLSGGWFDILKNSPYRNAGDARAEYRFGTSLLSSASPSFRSWDNVFQVHPMLGIEMTSRYQNYVYGGLVLDFLIGRYFVFSPNFAVGHYGEGEGKNLGAEVEFRSTGEIGFRFENEMRLTGSFGHISNAGLGGRHNPGAEIGNVSIQIPLARFLK